MNMNIDTNAQQIIHLLNQIATQNSKTSIESCYDNLIERAKLHTRPDTVIYYKKIYNALRPALVNLDIIFTEDLTLTKFESVLNYLRLTHNYSNNSLNKFVDLIKMIFKFNYKREFIPYHKILEFKKLPKNDVQIKTISEKMIRSIFQYLDSLPETKINLRNKLFMYMFFETGVRLNELLHIEVKNIDLENEIVDLTFTKSKKNRYLDFFEKTREALIKYLTLVKPKKYLFLNLQEKTQTQMTKVSIYKFLDKIKAELDIDASISPHKWRHTLGTSLMNNDVNIRIIQEVLGHSNINTTQMYLHVSKNKRKKDLIKSSLMVINA